MRVNGRGEASGVTRLGESRIPLPDASPLPIGTQLMTLGIVPPTSNRYPNGTLPGSLGAIIQNFKSVTMRRVNNLRRTHSALMWQRNYYDHIIRDEEDLNRIRAYILDNPRRWGEDDENPAKIR